MCVISHEICIYQYQYNYNDILRISVVTNINDKVKGKLILQNCLNNSLLVAVITVLII